MSRDTPRGGLTVSQIDTLRHMVGRSKNRRKIHWGFRNYFAATPGSADDKALDAMHELGLVIPGARGALNYWHCTEEGCRAAGLNDMQTTRAIHGD